MWKEWCYGCEEGMITDMVNNDFEFMDENKDGALTKEEIEAAWGCEDCDDYSPDDDDWKPDDDDYYPDDDDKESMNAEDCFNEYDENKNGSLSLEEFTKFFEERGGDDYYPDDDDWKPDDDDYYPDDDDWKPDDDDHYPDDDEKDD